MFMLNVQRFQIVVRCISLYNIFVDICEGLHEVTHFASMVSVTSGQICNGAIDETISCRNFSESSATVFGLSSLYILGCLRSP